MKYIIYELKCIDLPNISVSNRMQTRFLATNVEFYIYNPIRKADDYIPFFN